MITPEQIIDTIKLIKNININNLSHFIKDQIGSLINDAKNILINNDNIKEFLEKHNMIISLFTVIFPVLSTPFIAELGLPADIVLIIVMSIILIYENSDNISDFFNTIKSHSHRIYEELKYYKTEFENFL